jgi:hypothetical protein
MQIHHKQTSEQIKNFVGFIFLKKSRNHEKRFFRYVNSKTEFLERRRCVVFVKITFG